MSFSYARVSYKCPKCSSIVNTYLTYIPHKKGKKHPETIKSHWCNRCGTEQKIDYRVFKRRDGSPKLKVFSLTTADVKHIRRFKNLAWN